jgi:hypothetical protein
MELNMLEIFWGKVMDFYGALVKSGRQAGHGKAQ